MHVDSTETGLKEEASSITTRRPSSSGSMRRINSESSPCSKVPILEQSFPDSQLLPSRLSKSLGSLWMIALVILHHAPLILVPLSEPRYTSSYHFLVSRRISSRLLPTSTMCRLEVSMVNILRLMMASLISQTEEDLVDPKLTSFKTCTMELRL